MKKLAFLAVLTVSVISASTQNIGIGVTNPTRAKFEVRGVAGSGHTGAIFEDGLTGISFVPDWPSIGFNHYYYGSDKYIGTGFAAKQYLDLISGGICFDLFPQGSANTAISTGFRAFSIMQSGNVYVGPHFSNSSFAVSRNSGSEATAAFGGSQYSSYFNYGDREHTYIRPGKDYGQVIINDVKNSGTIIWGGLAINKEEPAANLDIRQAFGEGIRIHSNSGNAYWGISIEENESFASLLLKFEGFLEGYFDYNGVYHNVSDYRIKEGIQKMPSILDKIMLLEPVEYKMKFNEPGPQQFGFIAQDVKKLFPELVGMIKDSAGGYEGINDLHTLNYSGFGILAIKAIQEQQQIIQSLQSRIETLESKVDALMRSNSVEGSRLK